jgi:sigma-E factor negative regulatory protein RseA
VTESRKESLSALIDGEATEIEVHRLLREFRSDDSLRRTWTYYQHVRTTVGTAEEDRLLSPDHHLSLYQRISNAIDEESTHTDSTTEGRGQVKVIAGSLALAASLVVAVFLGVQQAQGPGAAGESLAGQNTGAGTALDVQTVSTRPADNVTQELMELDEEKQRRLRAYLNQHDRMSRMNDNRQLVNYKEVPSK